MPNPGTQVLENQIGDVEPTRSLEWRQARRADRLWNDAAGHETYVRRVQHSVVIGEPDAGDRDRGVLQDQLDHLIGGFDVRECAHHRGATVDLAGSLEPAEADEGRAAEVAGRQRRRARWILGEKRIVGEAAIARQYRF